MGIIGTMTERQRAAGGRPDFLLRARVREHYSREYNVFIILHYIMYIVR